VATPSAYVRGTVVDAFDVDPEQVVVVPHGVPGHRRPEPDAQAAVLARHGVDGSRYVVYPAITHPHKGHRVLVDMLGHLPDVRLVLTGGAGSGEEALRAAVRDAGVGDRIVRTGRVDDLERDALVAGAAALVFPSEYEGFGAPLVEAMMLGTPVVCSDHPAVVEVVGGAGLVVGERTGEAWAAAVQEAFDRPGALVEAGSARAAAFTLERSGAALADTYRRVAAAGTTG
jgi:glycosyltransferase involved in cell wall biosynthesis